MCTVPGGQTSAQLGKAVWKLALRNEVSIHSALRVLYQGPTLVGGRK